ncbi:uncharacterized protein LOC134204766 [Armigeres subalbatus]|uniref:uncharacterized protein LOC134204766 n=1 Tax=Armigeres subalbatus TaxID=124917 RepID=UPI002ED27E53
MEHALFWIRDPNVTSFRKSFVSILPKVTVNLPTSTVDTQGLVIPKGVRLADPGFFKSAGVVLGIELFFSLFNVDRKMSLGNNMPTLIDAVFGWVVCGTMEIPTAVDLVNCNMSMVNRLEDLLTRFWECEEVTTPIKSTPEEDICEEEFQRTVQRTEDGRTERRLDKEANLGQQYEAFMEEYLQLQDMKEVPDDPRDGGRRCYLPHHPVVKEASTTTKVQLRSNN